MSNADRKPKLGSLRKMTVLEDDVIPVHNKLSLTKRYVGSKTKGGQLKRKSDEDINSAPRKQLAGNMLNGYKSSDHHRSVNDNINECPVATLSNTGNTCYLNSVLYTLRFAPTFLHNLHHLVDNMSKMHTRLAQNKTKSSSLGRSVGSISGPSSRSTSSKDLLALGSINDSIVKSKVQLVTEKLHELFVTLRSLEETRKKDSNESYQPVAFMQAVREANSIFEGNQQQDAHELLVYLLDNIRETCNMLADQVHSFPDILSDGEMSSSGSTSKSWLSWKKGAKKKDKAITEEDINDVTDNEEGSLLDSSGESSRKKLCYNFVFEDFQGITLRRTKCLECESVTERKEPFYDIPVPINFTEADLNDMPDPSDVYKKACVTSEKLCDMNKYLCETCIRYNEASREVSFEKLPNIMVLQLKRFMTTNAGVQKVNTYMPTPLRLKCFCETCCQNQSALHRYELCCVIMHLGGAMASGHYIAYVRANDQIDDYTNCSRDINKTNLSASGSEKTLNNKSLIKYIKQKVVSNPNVVIEHRNGITSKNNISGVHVCKSRTCCGVKINKNAVENAINYSRRNGQHKDAWQSPLHDVNKDMWLECDDESVKAITSQELQELLDYKADSTSTPYLLFYLKITEGGGGDN